MAQPVTPTPRIKGNLPRRPSDEYDESQGRELPPRPVEWYERNSPRNSAVGGGSFTNDPDYDQLPEITERYKRGRGDERGGVVYQSGGIAMADKEPDKKVPIKKIPTEPMKDELKFDYGRTGPPRYPSMLPGTRADKYGSLNREEDDATNTYNRGGAVKHGSSTCVACHYTDGRKYNG